MYEVFQVTPYSSKSMGGDSFHIPGKKIRTVV
jgi:hypothetical protein